MGTLYVLYPVLCLCLVVGVAMVNCTTMTTTTPPLDYDSSKDTTSGNIGDQLVMLRRQQETLSTELQEIRHLQQRDRELRHSCVHPCSGADYCGGHDVQGLELSIKKLTSKMGTQAQTLTKIGDDIQALKNKVTQQQKDLDGLTQSQDEARQASAELNVKVDGMRTVVAGQQDDLDKLGQSQTTLQDGSSQSDGHTAAPLTNCREATGGLKSGVYRLWITPSDSHRVYCEGDWTVIQRRINGQVDFYQNWQAYKKGFGSADEYWLGLEAMHQMTSVGRWQLRVDLGDWESSTAYALYSGFKVGPESDYYRLSVESYDSGNAGDSLHKSHNGRQFSTKDQDHDAYNGNCAVSNKGAWWYAACHSSNLNGLYKSSSKSDYSGIIWQPWKGYDYSLKSAVMKIRPL